MLKNLDTVWNNCLITIRQSVNRQSFKTWFEPIKPVKLEDNVLTIQVPSQFFYEWLEEHYVSLLHKTMSKELGPDVRLEYQIVLPVDELTGQNNTHGYSSYISTKQGTNSQERTLLSPQNTPPVKNPFVIAGIKDLNIDSNLKVNLTFETFVEGQCNQLARSAGIAVANRPGQTSFNPLVLYGGTGLGKTHLAQAIGNHVNVHLPDKTVLYVSSEKFTNQFIDAVRNSSMNEFMNFYQLIDVLIVDDIQFFANKEKTQEMFFHTFNHLHQSGKQIVLTSDRPPKDLKGMEERLLSRFKWGLTADLQRPDLETRIAILEMKLFKEEIDIPREVVEYIAYHINTNVRELEGALISLMAQSSLNRKEIDVSLAKIIVKNFINDITKEISVESIQEATSEYFKVSVDLLKSKTRKRHIVQARQVAMYLAKQFTEASLKKIGEHFGGRDHSTVIHACQAVLNLMETDNSFHEDVIELKKQINFGQ